MENVQVQHVSIDVLKPHPRNNEFFDDIQGKEFEDFKEKIRNEGIMTPLLVTPDFTIISGHQRTRAAKDLGIKLIPVIIMEELTDEDVILRKLIASNSGRLKNNEEKARKAIAEYVELCGYKNGEHEKLPLREGASKLSQKEIAQQLGMSVANLQRVLSIERNLTEDMKEMLDTGTIGKNLAADCIASLSPEEQQKLISDLGLIPHEKANTIEIKNYITKCKQLEDDNNEKNFEIDRLNDENADLRKQLKEKPETKIVIKKEDAPETLKKLQEYKKDNSRMAEEYREKVTEFQEYKKQSEEKIAQYEEKLKQKPEEQNKQYVIQSCLTFCAKVKRFINEVGGYAFLDDDFALLPDIERQGYLSAINALETWLKQTKYNIDKIIDVE